MSDVDLIEANKVERLFQPSQLRFFAFWLLCLALLSSGSPVRRDEELIGSLDENKLLGVCPFTVCKWIGIRVCLTNTIGLVH